MPVHTLIIYSFFFQLLVQVPNMHGFVVTSLAFVFAKNNAKSTTDKGKSVEALLSISADKSCCATTVTSSKGIQENAMYGMSIILLRINYG